ncbi:uncharacterized protein TM35_000242640 [Trypanosoma theileri]|uniref:Uncharacterized protein n=1 Tax=Trypanosoma theileri TaxID=67003 RepID=A0A1X0NQZ7_9TRYP|nr:uncharacterized protein TM35_000242640 [Trypanosoma theileri]ORC87114.1 hypothetical protein TM35_000242640 [Trypanosoma theileri]
MDSSNDNNNNNNNSELIDIHADSAAAAALLQAMKKNHLVAYYTHPSRLPLGHSGAKETKQQQQTQSDDVIMESACFSFLPFPTYCGLNTVDKVLYKHHLSFDVTA